MPDTLSIYAQSQPDKPGVIDDKPDGTVVTWTYAELEAQSNRVANLLLSLGAGPGKKVLWCGPNSPEVVAVMNATRKIGAVAVPLNYRLTPEEALYVINHSDAEVAYVDYEHVPMFAALRGQLDKVRDVYPAEIEAALEQHPGIYDVAVFGIPSEQWGEVVHATVVRSPGSSLTGEEITAFARGHLASYKVPRSVEFTDELPRTGSGKLLKRQLRAPYWADRTARVG